MVYILRSINNTEQIIVKSDSDEGKLSDIKSELDKENTVAASDNSNVNGSQKVCPNPQCLWNSDGIHLQWINSTRGMHPREQ
jgi:hypothetical protein